MINDTQMSQHETILEAVKTTITTKIDLADGSLDGIASADVAVCWLPEVKRAIDECLITNLPCILICPGDQVTVVGNGSNGSDDFGYPATITIVSPSDRRIGASVGLLTGWRETIRNLFHNKRLSGVTTAYKCETGPAPAMLTDAFTSSEYFATGFLVRVLNREVRS